MTSLFVCVHWFESLGKGLGSEVIRLEFVFLVLLVFLSVWLGPLRIHGQRKTNSGRSFPTLNHGEKASQWETEQTSGKASPASLRGIHMS